MPNPLSILAQALLILMLASGASSAQALDPHDTFEADQIYRILEGFLLPPR
ncbi:hypothetical protein SAMN04487859_111114 [Roseovarius lutimaris]|uniref:Uncharacterized protein n=1 Tax=Roseovarius lutimaris TaxID=1005928 RepID=A0A1I5D137_9RHOB|nr:hypothetical protein SAMN04487859_111114 [Roseovarius lutimaris]